MSDIVTRLKQRISELCSSENWHHEDDSELMRMAVTEIERLKAALSQYQVEREMAGRATAPLVSKAARCLSGFLETGGLKEPWNSPPKFWQSKVLEGALGFA